MGKRGNYCKARGGLGGRGSRAPRTASCPRQGHLQGELLEPPPLHPTPRHHKQGAAAAPPLCPGLYPNTPGSPRTYPHSKYKYLKINAPLVRATENISSIKVNVKGIHTRSKGHEIENNHMPSSRGPSARVAFTSAA